MFLLILTLNHLNLFLISDRENKSCLYSVIKVCEKFWDIIYDDTIEFLNLSLNLAHIT